MSEEYTYTPSQKGLPNDPPPHYYGDTVRVLFLVGGIVQMVTTAFYRSIISVPIPISMLGVMVLILAAGFTTHKNRSVILFDLVVSLFSTFYFEYIVLYGSYTGKDTLFWIYQALALNFLFALYFSVKTFRNSYTQ
jgi:hypothetical protein